MVVKGAIVDAVFVAIWKDLEEFSKNIFMDYITQIAAWTFLPAMGAEILQKSYYSTFKQEPPKGMSIAADQLILL